jgi:hypothetical protein
MGGSGGPPKRCFGPEVGEFLRCTASAGGTSFASFAKGGIWTVVLSQGSDSLNTETDASRLVACAPARSLRMSIMPGSVL